jgi:CRISPR-associated protein Cmr2
MDPERARLKIQALLHDTPDKALILGRYQGGHEAAGRNLLQQVLGEQVASIDPRVKQADRIASGADRMPFARERYAQLVDFLKEPELRHPFDGRRYTVRTLSDIDPAVLAEDLETTVRELLERVPAGSRQDPERLYWLVAHDLPLALWGFDRESKLGVLWQHLPADTRVPDHSIWEHTRLTSALTGAGESAALLQISIGPVQSFIASARRVSDLWS